MAKFAATKAELQQVQRKYTRANRDDWAQIGFRMMTALVHDEDREFALAHIDVMRAERMVKIAESKTTSDEDLLLLSRRNMAKLPVQGEYDSAAASYIGSTIRGKLSDHIDTSKAFAKMYYGLVTQYTRTEDEMEKTRLLARAVAYSLASSAFLRMANAAYDYYPKEVVEVVEKKGKKNATTFGAN